MKGDKFPSLYMVFQEINRTLAEQLRNSLKVGYVQSLGHLDGVSNSPILVGHMTYTQRR